MGFLHLRRRGVAVGLLAVACSAQVSGVLIPVGEHRMFLDCAGAATAPVTVVFEAGGGGSSKDWERVRALLPAGMRHCAYDRSGLGRSEPGPGPRTMHQEVFELHTLLGAAQVSRPLLLVGQSIGGLLVRLYAKRYPDDVAGMILVDATSESAVLGSMRFGGMVRLREKARERAVPEPRFVGRVYSEYNPEDDYLPEEMQLLYLARQTDPQPLGGRPLIVLAAGKRPAPPGMTEEVRAPMREEKIAQARGLAELSRNSKFVVVADSGHAIHAEAPEVVARAAVEMAAQAR